MKRLHKHSGQCIYESDCETIRELVEKAIQSGADLSRVDLYGADLSRVDLSRADLSGVKLSRAYLYGAYLYGANLSRANLSRADLTGANLSGADLTGADLSRADLTGADLSRADLTGANLSGADLSGADLSGAKLSGAYLYGANFYGADPSGAEGINPYGCTPLLFLYDQKSPIRAYKLVTNKNTGPYYPLITYEIGKEYSVDNADCDVTSQCSRGISLATMDWCMREWKNGYKILVAEFNVQDIAAIPTATDGKFRVHRCKIIGEKDLKEIGLIGKD